MTSLIPRMALLGLLQGLLLWSLNQVDWRVSNLAPLLGCALYAVALVLPLSVYFTQDIATLPARQRLAIVLGLSLAYALLGVSHGWQLQLPQDGTRLNLGGRQLLQFMLYPVPGFIALTLLAQGRTTPGQGWNYAALFALGWRNITLLGLAGILTGIFWMVLSAGLLLLQAIGIEWPAEVIFNAEGPGLVLSATVVGASIGLLLQRPALLTTCRSLWLWLNQTFLPLSLALGVIWVVALLFTGIEPLFATQRAALMLLWFITLAVCFVNAAYQDGENQPFVPWLRLALRLAWLALLPMVVLAGWALWLRIAAFGWTQDRLWAVVVLCLATLYTVGYALSNWRPQRGWFWSVPRTNLVVAFVTCLGLSLLFTPWLAPSRIAVDSQLARLLEGDMAPKDFDYHYLARDSGRYGYAALQALAQRDDTARDREIARQALAWLPSAQPAQAAAVARTPDEVIAAWQVLPAERRAELEARLLTLHNHLQAEGADPDLAYTVGQRCLNEPEHCLLWFADLNGDGTEEVAMVLDQSVTWGNVAAILSPTPGNDGWSRVADDLGVSNAWIAGLKAGTIAVRTPRWREIVTPDSVLQLPALP